jgi:hypothetical protein
MRRMSVVVVDALLERRVKERRGKDGMDGIEVGGVELSK